MNVRCFCAVAMPCLLVLMAIGRTEALTTTVRPTATSIASVHSDNKADVTTPRSSRASAAGQIVPMLSNSYLPAVMQAIAYYVELLQYEIVEMTTVEPPFTIAAAADEIDLNPATPTTPVTAKIPVRLTTTEAAPVAPAKPTPAHAPGYFAPETQKPLLNILNKPFVSWFLQNREDKLSDKSEYDLQYLHQLPLGLLEDIRLERYQQPALADEDNVNEFRRIYDDFYGRKSPLTGKKRVPPTKPYVQMLMLYDLLKRDAKKLMLHKFEGYTPEMLAELNETANGSAERQLYTLFWRMLDRKDMDKEDIRVRCTSMMEDLINPDSITSKSLRYLPPLQFWL